MKKFKLGIIVTAITSTITCMSAISAYSQNLQMNYDDVNNIRISVNISPIKDTKFLYDYNTNNVCEIAYITNYLNSLNLNDDGKNYGGGELSVVNIDVTKKDGLIDKMGFVNNRFYDVNNKQYAIDKTEYNRILDFIYALKTEKLVLDNEMSLEASGWANTYIEQALMHNLIPKVNQIGYANDIPRVEVCQLIDNLLSVKGIEKDTDNKSTFVDTDDISVTALYNKGIIDGKSETEFCPYDYITREEFAKMLDKTYSVLGLAEENGTYSYADESEISDWAKDCVNKLYFAGIMNGKDNNEFKPKDTITKQEVITTIVRVSDR